MWLRLVLQVYLHQIINLNTNVLKVFQVSLQLFLGQGLLRMQKVEIFDVPPHACIHKMIHFEKRKFKYTSIFYLYLREARQIKNTRLDSNTSCILTILEFQHLLTVYHNSYQKLNLDASWFVYQRELLNLLLCSVEKILHSSTIVAINLSCVKPPQFRRNSSCLCNIQQQSSKVIL